MSSDDDEKKKMNQSKKNIRIKNLNDHLDKIIEKSKSFNNQIKSIEK